MRFVAAGFATLERTVVVPAGKVVDLGEVTLEPAAPRLTIDLVSSEGNLIVRAAANVRKVNLYRVEAGR